MPNLENPPSVGPVRRASALQRVQGQLEIPMKVINPPLAIIAFLAGNTAVEMCTGREDFDLGWRLW
jgi:hypothetical protein